MIIIQTTVDDDKKAKELINLLVETNKIACGTFHEIQSSYKWKEKLVEEQVFEISMYTKVIARSCRYHNAKTPIPTSKNYSFRTRLYTS